MKTCNLKKRTIMMFNLCFSLFISFVSCQENESPTPEPAPTPPKVLKVETLVPNFQGNGAVSVDNQGTVYVSEYGVYNNETGQGSGTRLFKISPQGQVLDTLKNLTGPMGTKKDSKGNLYINNDNNNTRGIVVKVTPNGERSNFATVPGWPSSTAIKNDVLFVTNYNSPTIHTIDTKTGNVSLYLKDDRLTNCVGIDFDSNGNLLVSNFSKAIIYSINKDKEITKLTTIDEAINQGWGIGYLTVVDDIIYATGIAVSKIYKISLDGKVEVFAGNGEAKHVDGKLSEASFYYPNGISSNKTQKILYISEYGRGIRKIEL